MLRTVKAMHGILVFATFLADAVNCLLRGLTAFHIAVGFDVSKGSFPLVDTFFGKRFNFKFIPILNSPKRT